MSLKLPPHEWIIVGLILTIMLSITGITAYQSTRVPKAIDSVQQEIQDNIEVKVEGAVQKPNFYLVPKGTTVESILEQAEPTAEADLKKLKLKEVLRDGQRVKVPKKEMITVTIQGAVKNPGPVIIEKGARLQDLIQLIELDVEADVKALKKKRKLKDQEVVEVPLKGEGTPKKKPAKAKKAKKRKSVLKTKGEECSQVVPT